MIRRFRNLSVMLLTCIFFPALAVGDGVPENASGSSGELGRQSDSMNVPKNSQAEKDLKEKASSAKKLPPYSISDQDLLKYQYCGKDSDCMQVVNGCCQCMQGDPITSINRKYISEFERRFNCENVKCPLDSETHRCMDGLVSCIKFRCTYFPPE